MAEDHDQPKSPMDKEDKSTRSEQGRQSARPADAPVSGLDVRQLLGLGREEPKTPTAADGEEDKKVEQPAPEAARPKRPVTQEESRQDVDELTSAAPEAEKPVERRVERRAVPQEAPPKVATTMPRSQLADISPEVPPREPVRPSAPIERPSRPAFEPFEEEQAQVETPAERSADENEHSRLGSSFSQILDGSHRQPPPVSDPTELPNLRPAVDPLVVNAPAPVAAAPASELDAPATPALSSTPVLDPGVAANAKLEELASMSERTLEDYESFDDLNDEPNQKSKRTPIIILASLLCIGVLAGGVVFAYRQGVRESSQTTLPIIVASTDATKEEPSDPGGVKIPHQNKLIYDRILGEETDIAEKIIPREEEAVTFSQQPAHTTVAKTTLPVKAVDAPGSNAPQKSQSPGTSSANDTLSPASGVEKVAGAVGEKLAEVIPPNPLSPPDSLVNGGVAQLPSANSATAMVDSAAEAVKPLTETLKLPTKNLGQDNGQQGVDIARLGTEAVNVTPAVPAIPEPTQQVSSDGLGEIKLVNETGGSDSDVAVSAKQPPTLPRSKPSAPAASITRVASVEPSTTTTTSTSGAYVVQIAAFRSQAEALSRFASLKRRHSGLLRPYTSFIQRADLGGRGVYYRLRLGPIGAKETASQLCRSLLSAGEKDCLVRTR